MSSARELIAERKARSSTAFVDRRVTQTKIINRRSVVRGKAVGRNPKTGEWLVRVGDGNYRHAKSVTNSDITGKSVNVTVRGKIGQIAGMPGFR